MKIKVIVLGFLLMCFSNDTFANTLANNLDKGDQLPRFISLNIASGNFEQKKYFKILKQPILSSGEIFFDKALGFYWQTLRPVASVMLLKNTGLYTDNGESSLKKINGAGTLAQVLMNAMSCNLQSLTTEFDVKVANNGYCVSLTPKSNHLVKVINLIELCSSKEGKSIKDNVLPLEKISIFELSGNRTEITVDFKALTQLPETIRAQLQ